MAISETFYRIEQDSMGEVKVPQDALYQAQTQRAVDNFTISSLTLPSSFIQALATIKLAAAQANEQLGQLEPILSKAIQEACLSIIAGEHLQHFPIDVFQTGSGTSSNMNANEVIATLANQKLEQAGETQTVHPNDHVNMGQSSNDVIPTAIQLSALIAIEDKLLPAMNHLSQVLDKKAQSLSHVVKTGRTHLMDAMPITMEQELHGWQAQVEHVNTRIQQLLPEFRHLAQGGTAVGTGINTSQEFVHAFLKSIQQITGKKVIASDNYFYSLSSQDSSVAMSGALKAYAASLMKIANDLRWMNSGPLTGIAEIELAALQPGSSIMPGKVNPVIPEAVAMASAQVIGNDSAITIAGQSGNFQLNVMLPVIAHNLLQSIELMANSSLALADKAIADFQVKETHIQQTLSQNPILVTALNSIIGYNKAAEIAKQAYKEQRPIIEVAKEKTSLSQAELETLLDPKHLIHN